MRTSEEPFAAEQYELQGPPLHRFSINRRQFFRYLGGGIAITFVAGHALSDDGADVAGANDNSIHAWIHVGENNNVTVYTGKVEVGQNIRTSLAQIVAEELTVPFESIEMVMGDTALTPYDMGTFGSRSIPYMGSQLRKAAASARELMKKMAAKKLDVDVAQLKVSEGKIHNTKDGKPLLFSDIVRGEKLIQPIDESAATTPPGQWKVCGTSIPKVNAAHFVTGKHEYVSDMKLPDMMYGKVLRPPAFGATLKSADLSRAQALPGVVAVHDAQFVGVCAPDPLTAERALTLVRAQWEEKPQPSRDLIFDYLLKHAKAPRGNDGGGDIAGGLARAKATTDKTFYVDYIAHAPLEPRAAVARWEGDKVTVWTGTQRPFGVQDEVASAFRIPKENVRVIMPDTGSGYGGKHTGDAALEAARLAREAQRPVKIVWTREEEFTWAYFRPAGVIQVKAGADASGKLTAWEFHNYNSGGSAIQTQYDVDQRRIQFHPVDSPLRQGSYRGLAGTANIFARESAMDDLANDLGIDPLEFRMTNLSNERLKNVLKACAEAYGWSGRSRAKGRGHGIGCGIEKGGYVATIAEVLVNPDDGQVTVKRAVAAFECGAIVNPVHLENQILGCVVQGLGGALFEWIDFKNGRIVNPMFSRYRVPRFTDMPELEIVMVDRKDLPSAGAGEAPIYGIAPAIRNAIADAGGERLYSLPLLRKP
ncbi:MAG TPA: molybdopterin cofactor-binding domain-containing protein [Cyclobacteriaceae bacterium]|nr:molybdopterin cofactor-binding domain-containing protein [Cyclobacteriaceae bacterium]